MTMARKVGGRQRSAGRGVMIATARLRRATLGATLAVALVMLALGSATASGATLENAAAEVAAAPPSWAYTPQATMGAHTIPEPTWRRVVRTTPEAIWVGLFVVPLLLGFVLARRRQRRANPAKRPKNRGKSAALLVVSSLLAALSGVLSHRVAQRLLPPPRIIRGLVQSTPQPPPPGYRGIYAWGESTMHGDVFGPLLSIPKVVAWSLRNRIAGGPLQVQNLARPGASLSQQVPSGLFALFEDKAKYRPAAVLIYVGHNEYYNFRQDEGTGAGGGRRIDLDAERAVVEARYEAGLRALATRAKAAQVPLFIALPTSNLEGHPPPGPRHGAAALVALSGPEHAPARAAFERDLDRAEAALASGDAKAALAAARSASRRSPAHAWATFLRGRALRQLGQEAAARIAFEQAHVQDSNRQRALSSQNAIIERLCTEGLAHCVDAGAAIRAEFTWLDDRAFIDLHHPVARGHGLIGQAFARAIAAALHEPEIRVLPRTGWPQGLDPTAAMRERYLQTAGWYLVLAEELRDGYARAQRDALRRVERNLLPLQAALPALDDDAAERLRRRLQLLRLMVAVLAKNRPEAQRLHDVIWTAYDWSDSRHPLPEPWMKRGIARFLGEKALLAP